MKELSITVELTVVVKREETTECNVELTEVVN